MSRPQPSRFTAAAVLSAILLLIVAAVQAQSEDTSQEGSQDRSDTRSEDGRGPRFLPNGILFPNANGTSSTISTTGRVDLTGPFFQSLGTNGRSCGSCHLADQGMSIAAGRVQQRFDLTQGLDPIFRPVDGSNCDTNDVSTLAARRNAYSLLRTRGLIRIEIPVPGAATYTVTDVANQYGCDSTSRISMYRRPLPSTNLRFLSAVMWDGRESAGPRKITYENYSTQLIKNLLIQSLDATNGHAQGTGLRPTDAEKAQIVDFEMALFSAQATGRSTGRLNAQGAHGGPRALVTEPFFISINSSINPFFPLLETPGGRFSPGDGLFSPDIFDLFNAWGGLPSRDPRAAVARGQTLFNTTPIVITGVAGINDPVSAGGLGLSSFTGTCGTCHDTPNVGNHSFATPLNIGTGDPMPGNPNVNLGGLDIQYLPQITACTNPVDPATCKTTTDLGQALIDGNLDHVGKIKGPILRSLSSRAPYFHNGAAKTLLDVVKFYEVRFGMILTPQQESDLVAFLSSL